MVIRKPCNCFALMSTEEEKDIKRSVETHVLSLKFLVGWHKRKKTSPSLTPGFPVDNSLWLKKSIEKWGSGQVLNALNLKPIPSVAHVFTLKEMRKATDNFSPDNLIGEGGFGQVYRGVLSDGKVVAVKKMDPGTQGRQITQGEREFRVEVDILSRLDHPNLVRLIGYCADRTHRLLVYEYMTNGNLQELLHGVVRIRLEWHHRLRIALGAARALEYLHTGRAGGNPIIHRDFKSSNILLDEDFNSKVSDFGLAKLVPFGDKPYVSTRVIGTFGYFDPKYTATGRLTVKSDVYGFGVVCLELLTGRRPVDASYSPVKESLVCQVKEAVKSKKKLKKVVDAEMNPATYTFENVKRFADLAARCIRDEDSKRPMMSECVHELEELYAHHSL
ncbi:hypothetical protein R1flu_012001 [Riccia fluitans]|uniref:Protein kinase domain-containing protein n=1 Tax=Riccia fluitans TaxID=41844 RepID=A0ABD1Z9E4_9MARC